MGRVGVGAVLATVAIAGCASGGPVALRAASVDEAPRNLPVTATSTPTLLPIGDHRTMLVCPRRNRAAGTSFVLR